MKKNILIIIISLILILFFSFNSNAQTKKHYELIETTEKDYLKAKSLNVGLKIKKGRKIEKENYIMALPIEGDTIFLRDNLVKEKSPYMKKFDYIGEIIEISKYVIKVVYFNDSQIWLVDKKDGTITGISCSFIATTEALISYEKSNINIYINYANFLNNIGSIIEPNWTIDDIVWISSLSFIIKARKSYLDKDKTDVYYKVYIIK
ncbi:MAG: hypothetical protein LBM25_00790 [Bacteroidales bacterium]|jgi:hypothetical protein|nr:hypothetical protein [Bacteroidales bacterium]